MERKVLSAMTELGFTKSESKVYTALLKKQPATGYELAASSGVPRSAIYNILKKLESGGLINAIHVSRVTPRGASSVLSGVPAAQPGSVVILNKTLDRRAHIPSAKSTSPAPTSKTLVPQSSLNVRSVSMASLRTGTSMSELQRSGLDGSPLLPPT